MAKRVQQDSGEERVTAKSRPMMSLIARVPSNISSSASESPRMKSYGNQSPWSAKAEKEDRTGQPVVVSDPRTAPGYKHLLKALTQHATQSPMITKLGLLKSGKLTNQWMIDRDNPL